MQLLLRHVISIVFNAAVAVPPMSRKSARRDRFLCAWEVFESTLADSALPDCLVVLCASQFSGNVGACLRTCALLGIKWVVVLEGPSSGFCNSAFRAAQVDRLEHAETWDVKLVPAPRDLSISAVLSRLRTSLGYELIGLTDAPAAVPIWYADLSHRRMALVFGRESGGIPSDAEALLHSSATVPQVSNGCLNVSHAVAMTVYERHRQLSLGPHESSFVEPATDLI